MLSSIVKNLKRVMAAEYSRELSTKVHAGQSRIVRLGFRHGGYRSDMDCVGSCFGREPEFKGLLNKGELKCLRTDRVRVAKASRTKLPSSDDISTVLKENARRENRSDAQSAEDTNRHGSAMEWAFCSAHTSK